MVKVRQLLAQIKDVLFLSAVSSRKPLLIGMNVQKRGSRHETREVVEDKSGDYAGGVYGIFGFMQDNG
jgi:hypothetical protein